jgi:hypothetical protein
MVSEKQIKETKKEMDRLWKLATKQAKNLKPFLADKNFSKYYKLRGQYVKLKRQKRKEESSE